MNEDRLYFAQQPHHWVFIELFSLLHFLTLFLTFIINYKITFELQKIEKKILSHQLRFLEMKM